MVSVAEKVGRDPAVVRSGETSESKPSMKSRNSINDVGTGSDGRSGISRGGALKPGLGGIRPEGGVNPDKALVRNVGTCRCDRRPCPKHDGKVKIQAGGPGKDRRTDAQHRDRAVRSSDEGAVMALERRGSGIQLGQEVNR